MSTEARAIARRLEALAEHLTHQPLTHADSVDIATIREAATALSSLRQEIAAKDAELARQIEVRDDAIDDLQQKWWFQSDRADRAEAQLAEANRKIAEKDKALEPFAKASGLDGHQRDNEPLSGYWADIDNEGPNAITFGHLRAARRALEAQGGEDVL